MFYQLRAVMQKEFAGYFRTPTAYIIIAVYLVLSMFATFYSAYFFAYDNSGLISFFTYQPEIFVVLMPAATMRLWADERRSGTIEFLLTQPARLYRRCSGKIYGRRGIRPADAGADPAFCPLCFDTG